MKQQANLWTRYMPNVFPYYAVKSNDNPVLIRYICESFGTDKVGFDCASISEMAGVRKISKFAPIIYAQPCKTETDIDNSLRYGIRATIVDSPEEMEKLGMCAWKSSTYIRLAVPDSKSKQPFSNKFGAPLSWVPEILDLAKKYKTPITGLSFHVGSECENPEQFSQAIELCRKAADMAALARISIDTIDIGGGFLPTESNIAKVAAALNESKKRHFPDNKSLCGKQIQWIAEPGRFISAPSQTLYTPIIGRKRGLPSQDPSAPEFRYTINESIYGHFSNIPFDKQTPKFDLVYRKPQLVPHNVMSRTYRSTIFGRTCDGADVIAQNIKLPFMSVGDWLRVLDMGAYTNVTASEFNGFPKPEMVHDED